MRGLNKVTLIGNVGADPEVKYMPNGAAVVNFTIATGETWKDKATGDQKERTEWHRVVAYRQLAEIIAEYLRKGSSVYIEGKLQTRKWQNKDGHDQYTTEIIADQILMLGNKAQERPADRPAQTNARPAQPQNRRPPAKTPPARGPVAQQRGARPAQPQNSQQYESGEDQDIPFDPDPN